MDSVLRRDLLNHALNFINADVAYTFTPDEKEALEGFFTNLNKKVFFVHLLPENMIATLLAMYSRLKNPRGIRGVFVDSFLPAILAEFTDECEEARKRGNTKFNGDAFLKKYSIRTLPQFLKHSNEVNDIFDTFLENIHANPDYVQEIASSEKTRKFLNTWLDAYGHNSIARTGTVHICCEGISILAAKSLEWSRPASAFIELSTRYVDMSATGVYPIENELAMFGMDPKIIRDHVALCFGAYQQLQGGDDFRGPLPQFFRETYGRVIPADALEKGVFGETCDVLGNLLPSSTLTSVGMSISGEGLSGLIKHLWLDQTPENFAIADAIIMEAEKTGAEQFLRHMDITLWDTIGWEYLKEGQPQPIPLPDRKSIEAVLTQGAMWNKLFMTRRGEYDKLPRIFEAVSVAFSKTMSFRGWRDLQRMTFCAHRRGLVRPRCGFYRYDKSAPAILHEVFREIDDSDRALFVHQAARVANDEVEYHPQLFEFLLQYPMALGTMVPFTLAANLREMEFCDWQRSDWSANHEVRQTFLSFYWKLCEAYPWWEQLSRADTTPAYVFARGAAVPLTRLEVKNP